MDLIRASADVLASVDAPWSWLTEVERDRAATLRRPADRDDFVAAHVLVRQAVAALAGVAARDVTIVQTCETCGGPHGAPQVPDLPDVHASLTHAAGWVGAVAARRPVGIDVEDVAALRRVGVVAGAMTVREAAWAAASDDPVVSFGRLWVRKESLAKIGAIALDDVGSVELVDTTGLVDDWHGVRLSAVGPVGTVGAVALG